jgi:hypothetical protein
MERSDPLLLPFVFLCHFFSHTNYKLFDPPKDVLCEQPLNRENSWTRAKMKEKRRERKESWTESEFEIEFDLLLRCPLL